MFFGLQANAQFFEPYELPLTKIQARQINYAGDKNLSFAETGSGTMLGLTLMSRGKNLMYYGSIDVGGQTGRQTFLDAGTEITSNYAYRSTSLELGLNLFPIARTEYSVNPYFGLAALGTYNNIEVKSTATFITLPKSDHSFTAGGKASLGFEWIPKNYPRRPKWTIYAEVGYRKESGTLLGQNFSLDGTCYTLGFGW